METIVNNFRYDEKGRVTFEGSFSSEKTVSITNTFEEDENGNVINAKEHYSETTLSDVLNDVVTEKSFEYQKIEDEYMCTKYSINGKLVSETSFEDFGTGLGLKKTNYTTKNYKYRTDESGNETNNLDSIVEITTYTDGDGVNYNIESHKYPDGNEFYNMKNINKSENVGQTTTMQYDYSNNIINYTTYESREMDDSTDEIKHFGVYEVIFSYPIDDDKCVSSEDYHLIVDTTITNKDDIRIEHCIMYNKEGEAEGIVEIHKYKRSESSINADVYEQYVGNTEDDLKLIENRVTINLDGKDYVSYCKRDRETEEILEYTNYEFEDFDEDGKEVKKVSGYQEYKKGDTFTEVNYIYYTNGNLAMRTIIEWKDINAKQNKEDPIASYHCIYEYDESDNIILMVDENSIHHIIYKDDKKENEIINTNYPRCKEIFESYFNKLIEKIS